MDIFIVDNVKIYRNIIIIASPLRINIPTIIVMSAHKENDESYKNYDQDTTRRSYNTTN
jgi:hypothetical protein